MWKIVIICICVMTFDLNDAVDMPPELLQRVMEAREQMKKPQHMFEHPPCDGVLGDQCEGDVFPYGGEMMAEMMATGPSCVKKGKECGILHAPCCEIDPDTNERVNLICEYRPEADVTKKYESGKCAENPNPPIRKAVPLRLDELKGRN